MDIGTAEIIDPGSEIKPRRAGLVTGSGSGSGGGGNPGGGGGDRPDEDIQPDIDRFVPGKSRILTGFLLLVVLMTFGGLIAAYVVIRTNNVAEWQPFELPVQIWISTVIILLASVTYHFGKMAVDRTDQPGAKKWFVITTVLGAAFISSQILTWLELSGRGFYVYGKPYAGFFYTLTAVHAVHVLGGIIALGSVLLRNWYRSLSPAETIKRQTLAHVVGWYWHLMGAVWVVLFVMLGFWK